MCLPTRGRNQSPCVYIYIVNYQLQIIINSSFLFKSTKIVIPISYSETGIINAPHWGVQTCHFEKLYMSYHSNEIRISNWTPYHYRVNTIFIEDYTFYIPKSFNFQCCVDNIITPAKWTRWVYVNGECQEHVFIQCLFIVWKYATHETLGGRMMDDIFKIRDPWNKFSGSWDILNRFFEILRTYY